MANIDRLINHQDALDMIDGIKKIGYALNPDTNPMSWANISDADLVTVMQKAYEGLIDPHTDLGWCVGDKRKVILGTMAAGTYNVAYTTETPMDLVLMDYDHYYLADGVTKCKFVVGFDAAINGKGFYTSGYSQNNYDDYDYDNEFTAVFNGIFPSGIKSIFKSFNVGVVGYNGYNPEIITITKLCPFSGKEVTGSTGSNNYSHSDDYIIEYFKTAANRAVATATRNRAYTNTNPAYTTQSAIKADGSLENNYGAPSASDSFRLFGVI